MDKQEIINEIKRTAAENNGEPLGERSFEKETCIRRTEWYGVYWAKWSEAVQEAGFEPNKPNQAYDEPWLIECFIRIIREVEEWPSQARVELICRNQDDLPSGRAFRNIFRTKSNLAARVFAYCQERGGYDDIIAICEPIVETTPT